MGIFVAMSILQITVDSLNGHLLKRTPRVGLGLFFFSLYLTLYKTGVSLGQILGAVDK